MTEKESNFVATTVCSTFQLEILGRNVEVQITYISWRAIKYRMNPLHENTNLCHISCMVERYKV